MQFLNRRSSHMAALGKLNGQVPIGFEASAAEEAIVENSKHLQEDGFINREQTDRESEAEISCLVALAGLEKKQGKWKTRTALYKESPMILTAVYTGETGKPFFRNRREFGTS